MHTLLRKQAHKQNERTGASANTSVSEQLLLRCGGPPSWPVSSVTSARLFRTGFYLCFCVTLRKRRAVGIVRTCTDVAAASCLLHYTGCKLHARSAEPSTLSCLFVFRLLTASSCATDPTVACARCLVTLVQTAKCTPFISTCARTLSLTAWACAQLCLLCERPKKTAKFLRRFRFSCCTYELTAIFTGKNNEKAPKIGKIHKIVKK